MTTSRSTSRPTTGMIGPTMTDRVYTAVTHDTGDGMEPQVYLSRSLNGIKFIAKELLDPNNGTLREYECEECGSVEVERPDGDWKDPAVCDDCGKEMEFVEELDELRESIDAVEAWDGREELTVSYFDGNMGKMTLGRTTLEKEKA